MYKFIDKMSRGNGLQGIARRAASLSASINLQFGQLPCNPVKNVTYIYLACTEYRLVPYSPACDLTTLGLTYTTPQSLLHSVPFTDISLYCNGNNPGKSFCTALLSFVPAY